MSNVLATPPSIRHPLALVLELGVVARGAVQADLVTERVALAQEAGHVVREADWEPVGVGAGVRRLGNQAVAVAVRVRPEQLPAARDLEVEEDVVRQDGRALRELVVPLAILLGPGLVEPDHRPGRRAPRTAGAARGRRRGRTTLDPPMNLGRWQVRGRIRRSGSHDQVLLRIRGRTKDERPFAAD